MIKVAFFLLAVVAVSSAKVTTPVKKCKGVTEDLYNYVVVSTPKGVCTKMPCELPSGSNVTAEVNFRVRKEVEKIILKANATALGINVEYPLPDAEKGCDLLTNTFCPVEAGTDANLVLTMNILKMFPKVSVDLVFFLLDQKQRMISCFEVLTKVVNAKSSF